jgi:hypothetical protein
MGWNDYIDDSPNAGEYQNLPEEARSEHSSVFDPDNRWIQNASREEQIIAMRSWFLLRYEDPANCTPYESREGGYQFICGGPYDPDEVIQERFSEYVPYEVMEEVISELHGMYGDEWAGIDHGDDWEEEFYDQALSFEIIGRSDPKLMIINRIDDIRSILSGTPEHLHHLIAPVCFGSVITALECYLWDTAKYWCDNEESVLHKFLKDNPDFKNQKFTIADVLEQAKSMEKIKEAHDMHLQTFVWHRLDKVKPMFMSALGIQFPEIEELMRAVIKRHDVVHRGSRDKDGVSFEVSTAEVEELINAVLSFSQALEVELHKAFPPATLPFLP